MMIVVTYLAIGLGFSLASWLEVYGEKVKNGEAVKLDLSMWVVFTLLWWLVAGYCYRSDISKTIPPLNEAIKRIEAHLKKDK